MVFGAAILMGANMFSGDLGAGGEMNRKGVAGELQIRSDYWAKRISDCAPSSKRVFFFFFLKGRFRTAQLL